MNRQPSPSLSLIVITHQVAFTALAALFNAQLQLELIKLTINHLTWLDKYFVFKRSTKLESVATHPPHVLVSAKVLLQSRRAKGGFSFGAEACHA